MLAIVIFTVYVASVRWEISFILAYTSSWDQLDRMFRVQDLSSTLPNLQHFARHRFGLPPYATSSPRPQYYSHST